MDEGAAHLAFRSIAPEQAGWSVTKLRPIARADQRGKQGLRSHRGRLGRRPAFMMDIQSAQRVPTRDGHGRISFQVYADDHLRTAAGSRGRERGYPPAACTGRTKTTGRAGATIHFAAFGERNRRFHVGLFLRVLNTLISSEHHRSDISKSGVIDPRMVKETCGCVIRFG